MATFLIQNIFTNINQNTFHINGILAAAAIDAGAIFFGIIYLTFAKNMKQRNHNTIAHYLLFTSYGAMMATIAIAPSIRTIDLKHTPYPPFAIMSWSFVGFGYYLISFGFYFSAISISQDISLRKSTRELAIKESELFDSIGTAQMEYEIMKKVLKIAKEQEKTLEEQTGIEIHEWQQQKAEQENIQDYIAEILEEVKKSRNEKNE